MLSKTITLFPSCLDIEIFTKQPCDFKQKSNKNFSEIWKVHSKIDIEKQSTFKNSQEASEDQEQGRWACAATRYKDLS